MDFSEILAHFGWHTMRIYTICSMFCRDTYNNYFLEYFQNINRKEESEAFPFNIIEKDGYTKIIYPNFVISNFKFIQTQVEFEGQKHDINMDSFMVVGNRVLNRPFVRWVMSEQHNLGIDDDNGYIVHVIDHNVEMFSLTDKDYIEIDKDNYLKKYSDE